MDHFPDNWGRPRSDVSTAMPTTHTQQPIVTGTSVVGLKFDKGVILAADNLASYGSLARFRDVERLLEVGSSTVVGVGGDISDMQYLSRQLDTLVLDEQYHEDGHTLRAKHVFAYLSRLLYGRRSKLDPLWNSMVVGGTQPNESPFLAYVDLKGTTYKAATIATGFGSHLAVPILRQACPEEEDHKKLSEADARKVIEECMKVLYYRDARSLDKYSLAIITEEGIRHERDLRIEKQSWAFAESVKGYGA